MANNPKIRKHWQRYEEKRMPRHCRSGCKLVWPFGKRMDSHQKIKNRTTIWSRNPLLNIHPQGMKSASWRHTCSLVFTEASFASQDMDSARVYQWTTGQRNPYVVCTHMSTSALLKNKALLLLIIDKDIMLSEINQVQTEKFPVTSLVCRI